MSRPVYAQLPVSPVTILNCFSRHSSVEVINTTLCQRWSALLPWIFHKVHFTRAMAIKLKSAALSCTWQKRWRRKTVIFPYRRPAFGVFISFCEIPLVVAQSPSSLGVLSGVSESHGADDSGGRQIVFHSHRVGGEWIGWIDIVQPPVPNGGGQVPLMSPLLLPMSIFWVKSAISRSRCSLELGGWVSPPRCSQGVGGHPESQKLSSIRRWKKPMLMSGIIWLILNIVLNCIRSLSMINFICEVVAGVIQFRIPPVTPPVSRAQSAGVNFLFHPTP